MNEGDTKGNIAYSAFLHGYLYSRKVEFEYCSNNGRLDIPLYVRINKHTVISTLIYKEHWHNLEIYTSWGSKSLYMRGYIVNQKQFLYFSVVHFLIVV